MAKPSLKGQEGYSIQSDVKVSCTANSPNKGDKTYILCGREEEWWLFVKNNLIDHNHYFVELHVIVYSIDYRIGCSIMYAIL